MSLRDEAIVSVIKEVIESGFSVSIRPVPLATDVQLMLTRGERNYTMMGPFDRIPEMLDRLWVQAERQERARQRRLESR